MRSAELNQHFARPGNRFWPALFAAGLTPRLLTPADQHLLPDLGIGITNLVARPSATAAEVTPAELRAGGRRLERLTVDLRPRVVALLGLTAYRIAFAEPRARAGRQAADLAGAQLWVLPNPSGLNAHAKPADHAAWLRQVGVAAGLLGTDPSADRTAPNPPQQARDPR